MPIAGEDLAAALEDLRRTVRSIDARVAALEALALKQQTAPGPDGTAHTGSIEGAGANALDAAGMAAVAGQGLLGLAGAYLLRALTDQGMLPAAWGYTAGVAWACAWLALAYRVGRRAASIRAVAFGVVACSVAYPLIWEASTRTYLIGAAGAGLALAAVTAAALLVASRIRVQALAWIVATFAVVTTIALLPGADRLIPASVFMIGLGIATLWLGYVRDWFALRWPVAAVADLLVCWVVFSVPPGRGVEQPATAVVLGLLLAAAYLGSILVRTLWRARDVLPFEAVQGFAALAVGIGGTLTLGGGNTVTVGVATVAFGAGCFFAAALAARQRGFTINFGFYTTLALALVITGVTLVLLPAGAALAFSTIAVLAAVMSAREKLPVIALQTACYALAGSLASNLLTASTTRLAGPAQWPALGLPALIVTVSAVGSLAILSVSKPPATMTARSARLVLLGIAALGTTAAAVQVCLPLVMVATGVDGGALATVRTVVIAAAAVALAWLAGTGVVSEALWMTYGVLVLGGVKLLLEDFTQSRPATLFVALAAYGGALIAAPRLARRRP